MWSFVVMWIAFCQKGVSLARGKGSIDEHLFVDDVFAAYFLFFIILYIIEPMLYNSCIQIIINKIINYYLYKKLWRV